MIMTANEPEAEDAAPAGQRYRAPALEKGLDVLELLARHGRAMTASQISVALERSMSELFRMIQVLEYKGYIENTPSGDGYELSSKLFTLAMGRAPVRTLLETALPIMRELCADVGQACHLAVASEDQIVVIARIENPGYLGFSVRPGHRRKLVDSTSGPVLYAFQDQETQAVWLHTLAEGEGKKALKTFIERTDQIRARGYEEAESTFVRGVTDLSAPLMGSHGAVAALTIPYLHSHHAPITFEATLARLLAAAERISAELNATH